jgi:ribosomal-protein-alanine N-acetyltransferase
VTATEQQVDIRWMIRRDMPSILDIESKSFEYPWNEEDFIKSLRQRDTIGMVAEIGDEIAGFMIYELHKAKIHVLSFAVEPCFRRTGIGAAMIEKLVSKLQYQRRNRIALEVRETNLAAQLFFRSQGFRAINTLKNFYRESEEDAYLMQYRVQSEEISYESVPADANARIK